MLVAETMSTLNRLGCLVQQETCRAVRGEQGLPGKQGMEERCPSGTHCRDPALSSYKRKSQLSIFIYFFCPHNVSDTNPRLPWGDKCVFFQGKGIAQRIDMV